MSRIAISSEPNSGTPINASISPIGASTGRRIHRRFRTTRFDVDGEEPLDPMANLVDLMLVFACGLIAALIGMSERIDTHFRDEKPRAIEKGRELPRLPARSREDGSGYESVGQVFRDPETGQLILISE